MFLFIDSFVSGGITLLVFMTFIKSLKANALGNSWLAVFLILVAISIFDKGLFDYKFYHTHLHLLGITDSLIFFIAPTLYLSIKYFVSMDKVLKKSDFFHYLIPVLLLPIFIDFIFKNEDVKLNQLNSPSVGFPCVAITYFLFSQIVIYWILSYLTLQRHQRNIQFFAASTNAIDLNWLKYFLFGIAGMILIFITEFYLNNDLVLKYASIGYLIAVYFLSYFVLHQNELFAFSNQESEAIKEIIEENNAKERQKRFSDPQLTALKIRLTDIMRTEKVYLDETLNLPKLAEKMTISTHDLSYLLNEGFGESFFQFINTYRVEAAKLLLLSDKHSHLNMLGIAYAVGFSSKTTFYSTFKKMTHQSPSEFRTAAKNEVQSLQK